MALTEYDTGDRVVISTSTVFQDSGSTAFDPDVVRFKVTDPSDTTTPYVYLTDSEVARLTTGSYTCTIDVETAGVWYYRIEGETSGGENRGAAEGSFIVKASCIA